MSELNRFTLAFDAWLRRNGPQRLVEEEAERLRQLRARIEAVHPVTWWNDYVQAGTNLRGNHFGVHFGFETDNDPGQLATALRKVAESHGFEFEIGETRDWDQEI